MDELRALLLDSGFQPLLAIPWQRAVTLWFDEKVDIVDSYTLVVRSPSMSMQVPAVVRLRQWLRVRDPRVRLSRRNLLLRDGFRCQYCGLVLTTSRLTIDHVRPRSQGGRTSWDNVVACCERCNRVKGGRTPEQAGMPLLRPPRPPRGLPASRDGQLLQHAPIEWHAWLRAA